MKQQAENTKSSVLSSLSSTELFPWPQYKWTSKGTVLLDRLRHSSTIKTVTGFHGIRNFITVSTTHYHWALSWTRQVEPHRHISLLWDTFSYLSPSMSRSPKFPYFQVPLLIFSMYFSSLSCVHQHYLPHSSDHNEAFIMHFNRASGYFLLHLLLLSIA
jgi:hypothetical protein